MGFPPTRELLRLHTLVYSITVDGRQILHSLYPPYEGRLSALILAYSDDGWFVWAERWVRLLSLSPYCVGCIGVLGKPLGEESLLLVSRKRGL